MYSIADDQYFRMLVLIYYRYVQKCKMQEEVKMIINIIHFTIQGGLQCSIVYGPFKVK